MSARLLLVEDDVDLARGLGFNLEREGHTVQVIGDGNEALAAARTGGFDLVLLDLTLPGRDGLEVLKALRDEGNATPVICVTARTQETDVVMGFGLGADDYVTKPFALAEVLARIDAVLRRAGVAHADRIALDAGTADLAARRIEHPDGAGEELTPIECDLLRYLHERRNRAVERADLLRDLWGVGHHASTRTLDNHVARLRRKIERDPSSPRHLKTVHGVGYRLEIS